MAKKIILLSILIFMMPCLAEGIGGGGMQGDSGSVPKVIYVRPEDGSTLDLTGKDKVIFEWRRVPIPGGNRESYKFVLSRAGGYERVASRAVDPRTFSVEIPSDSFEPGASYRWYVKQRDARTLVWSQHDDWYFKIAEK